MRILSIIFLILIFCGAHGQTKYQKDFEFYWETINNNFAYFDIQKTNWNKAKAVYQPVVDTITTPSTFIQLLESINNELYNGHISLNTNLPSSNKLIPTGADLWVKYEKKEFIITAIREGFGAERSGLKQGMKITHYNGELIESAVREFLPKSVSVHDERMYEYAANMLLAGKHNIKRKITALWKGMEGTYYPDSSINKNIKDNLKIIEYKKLASNIGFIKINNSLGNIKLIDAFDKALDSLHNTKALILDLRETPSGGNTTVARGVMGRFIHKEMPYQKHSLPNEVKQYRVQRSWIELVSPRGKTYNKPVVVLVGRWTGSMGEGMAIGFDGLNRAKIIGDKMAGLLGAIYSFTLPETNIGFSIPVEKLFHINGMPRENFIPTYYLESTNEKITEKAIELLRDKTNYSRK